MKALYPLLSTSLLAGLTLTANANLVAYYPVDSATDTSTFLDDIIDDATHGMTDGTTTSTDGSIVFDSTRGGDVLSTVQGHRFSAGIQDIDLTAGFTWSFWFKSPSADFHNSDSSGGDVIIGSRNGSWHKVQPKLTERWISHGDYNIDTGNWHHAAYTGFGDGTTNTSEFWVDGVKVSTFTNATSDGLATNDDPFEIGGSSQFSEDVTGFIDDIAIWNEVLSDQRIIDLSNGAQVIPEPSAFALIGLAGMGLFIRRRR